MPDSRDDPPVSTAQVALALGSNLGDSEAILNAALARLEAMDQIQVVACSHWYLTLPVGPPQPDYWNGCALLQVTLSPLALLQVLISVEYQFGRVRSQHWGPRSLDLDLLLYDNLVFSAPTLEIPHPRMRERAFVLVPLAEIAPDWIEPVTGQAIADLANRVDWGGIKEVTASAQTCH
jgi:2-amino-4-hydroxy-6-hydroxymethyldihydropteridine diphosphokinase